MGFLDKAKAAANDLASKADTALAGAGLGGPGVSSGADADAHLRDLGVLTYLEATGRAADGGERERLLAALRGMEEHGALRSFALRTTAPPPAPGGGTPPPPPGHAGHTATAPPPPPGGTTAPPPPAADTSAASTTNPAVAPPPPPPSWAGGGGGGSS